MAVAQLGARLRRVVVVVVLAMVAGSLAACEESLRLILIGHHSDRRGPAAVGDAGW